MTEREALIKVIEELGTAYNFLCGMLLFPWSPGNHAYKDAASEMLLIKEALQSKLLTMDSEQSLESVV